MGVGVTVQPLPPATAVADRATRVAGLLPRRPLCTRAALVSRRRVRGPPAPAHRVIESSAHRLINSSTHRSSAQTPRHPDTQRPRHPETQNPEPRTALARHRDREDPVCESVRYRYQELNRTKKGWRCLLYRTHAKPHPGALVARRSWRAERVESRDVRPGQPNEGHA